MLVSSRPLIQSTLVCLLFVSEGHAGTILPPSGSAAFNPATVTMGGSQTTTYTLTVSNPNATSLTNIQFSNTYPAGLVVDAIGNYTCATVSAPGNPGGTGGGSANFSGRFAVKNCAIGQ